MRPLKRKHVQKDYSVRQFRQDISTVKLVNYMPSTTSRGGLRF